MKVAEANCNQVAFVCNGVAAPGRWFPLPLLAATVRYRNDPVPTDPQGGNPSQGCGRLLQVGYYEGLRAPGLLQSRLLHGLL